MNSRHLFRQILVMLLLLVGKSYSFGQDAIERLWYNEEKTAKIQIFKATDGKFYGKIVWLKEPNNAEGKAKTDIHNSDKSKRNNPVLGLQMLKGFVKEDETHYEDGTIYDPKNGKTYSCKINNKGDVLDVRGYVGVSWIGRTTTWTKAD
jgi:uncharacterized protein (DUF2147 family)